MKITLEKEVKFSKLKPGECFHAPGGSRIFMVLDHEIYDPKMTDDDNTVNVIALDDGFPCYFSPDFTVVLVELEVVARPITHD